MGSPRRQLAGIMGDLHEPEFPLACGVCPVDTPQVMEAVSQAAAGGAPTVLVAMRIGRDERGRNLYSDVPVAVIVSPEDFRRLCLRDDLHGDGSPKFLPPGKIDSYTRALAEAIRDIRARGGEAIVMEVVAGAIEIFDDVEVRRVSRPPSEPPEPRSSDPAPAPEAS